jgi:hypothetical protein
MDLSRKDRMGRVFIFGVFMSAVLAVPCHADPPMDCGEALILLYTGEDANLMTRENPVQARQVLEALIRSGPSAERDLKITSLAKDLLKLDRHAAMRAVGNENVPYVIRLDIGKAFFSQPKSFPTTRDLLALRRLKLNGEDVVELVTKQIANYKNSIGLSFDEFGFEKNAVRFIEALGLSGTDSAKAAQSISVLIGGGTAPKQRALYDMYVRELELWLKNKPAVFADSFRRQWLSSMALDSNREHLMPIGLRAPKAVILDSLSHDPYAHLIVNSLVAELKRRGEFSDGDFDAVSIALQKRGFSGLASQYPLRVRQWDPVRRGEFLKNSDVPPSEFFNDNRYRSWGLAEEEVWPILKHLYRTQHSVWNKTDAQARFLATNLEKLKLSPAEALEIIYGEHRGNDNPYRLLLSAPKIFENLNRIQLETYFRTVVPANYFTSNTSVAVPIGELLRNSGFTEVEIVQMAFAAWARSPDDKVKAFASAMGLGLKIESIEGKRAIEQLVTLFDPMAVLKTNAEKLEKDHGILVADVMPAARFRQALEALEEADPNSPQFNMKRTAKLVTDRVQDTEVAKGLMRALGEVHGISSKAFPTDSLHLLGDYIGVDPDWAKATKLTSRTQGLRDLYSITLETRQHLGGPLFENLKIEPGVYEGKTYPKFLELLEGMHTITAISSKVDGKSAKTHWEELQVALHFPKHALTAADVERLHAKGEEILLERIRPFIAENMPNLSFEQLKQVGAAWGSLDPIFHLMGRFEGNPAWKKETQELAKVFQSVIEGKFEDLKFKGYLTDATKAANQMAPLKTDAQKQAWIQDHSVVEFYDTSKGTADPRAGLHETLRNTVGVQLTNNLPGLPTVSEFQVKKVQEIVALPISLFEKQEKLREVFSDQTPSAADKSVVAAVRSHLRTLTEIDAASQFAKGFLNLAKSSGFQYAVPQDALHDFATLASLAGAAEKIDQGEYIVATVTTHHPKLMATVGSLASDSSCQDYRGGGVIQTLMGYVEDANVKLTLGAGFKRADFVDKRDFDKLKTALSSGAKVEASIDAKDKSYTFTWKDASGNTTQLSTQGQTLLGRRHVMKLGATGDAGSGLFLERGYNTPGATTEVLGRQAVQLLNKVAKATESKTGVPIQIPPSQNPGGVYSDAGTGVTTAGYSIAGNPAQAIP